MVNFGMVLGMGFPKLFSPGPIDVSPDTYRAMCGPTIGHRGADFEALYSSVQPGLRRLVATERPVFLSTSSAWGVMEGTLHNLVNKKVLNLCCGAFSDKWHGVAKSNGYEAEAINVEWGQPIDPDVVRSKLSEGGFDVVTFIHNETSTGVMNNLEEVAKVVRSFEDVLLVVDVVSSFSAVPTPFDELGVDVMLAGVQKALAMPPGLAVFAVSERAMKRAEKVNNRGYYFDFLEFAKNDAKNNTPSTPNIPAIYGLRHKVQEIEEEGLSNRYARHEKTNSLLLNWADKYGFESLAPEGFRSITLGCFKTPDWFELKGFMKALRERHGFAINGGYGKIKGTTFRISNMGNETEETMKELFAAMDEILPEFKK